MKASEFREMTNEELEQQASENRREMFNLRMQSVAGQLEKPSRIRELRRNTARIRTILNERGKETQS